MMKIAVDAMGGDHAPKVVVNGIERARDQHPDLEFMLFGDPAVVQAQLSNPERITIVPTTEEIEMGEEPVRAIRRKKDSSLVRAAMAVKNGEADAFFSAGNTGAILAAGLFIVGRIKGIDRPGLTSILPVALPNAAQATRFVYLDSGANAESKERNLVQFAQLGRFYASQVLGVANPRVALLNNGAEADKGDSFHKAVHQLLAADDSLNFVGNVEASELLHGKADVVVSDGWTANAALKATEGTAKLVLHLLKDGILNGGWRAKLGYVFLKPVFKKIAKLMTPSNYGGAVLLGLKAPVVKAHGAADEKAIVATIDQIQTMLTSQVVQKTAAYFQAAEENGQTVDKPGEN